MSGITPVELRPLGRSEELKRVAYPTAPGHRRRADGTPVDWESAANAVTTDEDRRLLEELRFIAGMVRSSPATAAPALSEQPAAFWPSSNHRTRRTRNVWRRVSSVGQPARSRGRAQDSAPLGRRRPRVHGHTRGPTAGPRSPLERRHQLRRRVHRRAARRVDGVSSMAKRLNSSCESRDASRSSTTAQATPLRDHALHLEWAEIPTDTHMIPDPS
jgi:hypothetical protein